MLTLGCMCERDDPFNADISLNLLLEYDGLGMAPLRRSGCISGRILALFSGKPLGVWFG